MVLIAGQSYHLKDDFFNLVNDDKLMSNKENGGYRPHFCAIQDRTDSSIFWMIPISSMISISVFIKVKLIGMVNVIKLFWGNLQGKTMHF